MLQVRLAGDQGDPQVGDRGTGEDADMYLFPQMGENQALPVEGQIIHGNRRITDQAAAAGQGG